MSYYVYKFLNTNSETIYIGQTINIRERIEKQHFTKNGHLPKECYEQTESIFYAKLSTKTDMDITERYLISKYRPKYNTIGNTCDVTVELNEPEWIEYNSNLLTVKEKAKKLEMKLRNDKELYQSQLQDLLIENETLKIENENLINENKKLSIWKNFYVTSKENYDKQNEFFKKINNEMHELNSVNLRMLVSNAKGIPISEFKAAFDTEEMWSKAQEELEAKQIQHKNINNTATVRRKNVKKKNFLHNLRELFIG